MKTPLPRNGMRSALIAPCGMNCRLCRAYGRKVNPCPGCRSDDGMKPKTRVVCRVKTCGKREHAEIKYCFLCDDFPCGPLNHLDTRYRTKYGMSMIENLKNIKEFGIRRFVQNEKKRWACPDCGGILCVHEPQCVVCGYAWR